MPEQAQLMDVVKMAFEAEKRIGPYIWSTPLEFSRHLSKVGNCRVFLKLENLQRSGSFKFRGATNFILSLPKEQAKKGVVTSSTGNHGAAFAEILEIQNMRGIICLPENVSAGKLEVLKTYGNVDLKYHGRDCEQTEAFARDLAVKTGMVYVPPYNDPHIVAGQATVAVELIKQIDKMDAVFVPVGGGGLMAGIAGFLKPFNETIQCIGCLPENSPVMAASVKAGHIVTMASLPTLSDATAGGIEPGSITFDHCRKYVDEFFLVSEAEIVNSIRLILEHHFMLIEGGAALPVAAFLKEKEKYAGKTVVLVITGKKITAETLKKIL